MSTILYEDEKFLKIRETLKLRAKDFAYLWEYPERWNNYGVMEGYINKFLQDLCIANVRAFNECYGDANEPERILPSKTVLPYPTTTHLVKALSSIQYNIDEVSVNGCAKRLTDIIQQLLYEIVSKTPQWEAANVW